jgi:intraflagellar transport protein 80
MQKRKKRKKKFKLKEGKEGESRPMRLQLTAGNYKHTDFVTACGWVGNDLYTSCDDKIIHKITAEGDHGGDVVTLDSYPTDMHWFPSANKKQQSDMFAAACSDGTYLLVKRNGSIEKKIDAHKGAAVVAIRWNHEGTAIATSGEDGVVKIWSRSGMLRSTLAQTDSSVYSIAWSPDSNSLCFTSGKDVIIKPLQPQAKQLMWKAHDGTVLKVDWNTVNSLIITGGEDRKYKVWDSFGRPLYASKPLEFAVTAVSWSPNGELFGVGLYNSIRLCDKTGWTYSREITDTGSIYSISWTSDCTQLAGVGANGAVVFGQVLERKVEWQNIEAMLKETHKVIVHDILSDMTEELDFRDRVIGMAVGFGYLVVTTRCPHTN